MKNLTNIFCSLINQPYIYNVETNKTIIMKTAKLKRGQKVKIDLTTKYGSNFSEIGIIKKMSTKNPLLDKREVEVYVLHKMGHSCHITILPEHLTAI